MLWQVLCCCMSWISQQSLTPFEFCFDFPDRPNTYKLRQRQETFSSVNQWHLFAKLLAFSPECGMCTVFCHFLDNHWLLCSPVPIFLTDSTSINLCKGRKHFATWISNYYLHWGSHLVMLLLVHSALTVLCYLLLICFWSLLIWFCFWSDYELSPFDLSFIFWTRTSSLNAHVDCQYSWAWFRVTRIE